VKPLDAARDYVRPKSRRTIGADIFVESPVSPDELGKSVEAISEGTLLRLKMISNRGTKVYPATGGMTDYVDQWCCRFVLRDEAAILNDEVLLALLGKIGTKYRWMHIEKLEEFDGVEGFTRAQGED